MTIVLQNLRRLAVLTLLVAAPAAWSQSYWDVVPELGMRVESQDNVLLRQGEEAGSAQRTVVNVGATFTNVGQRGVLFIEPRIRADAYMKSEEDLDSEDYSFRAGGRHRWQTTSAGFRADYSRTAVIRSEFAEALPDDFDPEDPELEDPVDVDTGRLEFFNEHRTQQRLLGTLDFQVSPRNRFALQVTRSDVSFSRSDDFEVRRSPFDNTRVSLIVDRRVDERNRVSARMFAAQYNADRTQNTTDTVGVEGTFVRPLNPIWTFNLTVGVERSDFELIREATGDPFDNADANFTFALGLRQRGERSDFNVGLIRRVSPNANGYVSLREEVHAYWRHAFTQRLGGLFGARVSKLRTVGDVSLTNEREYGRLEAGFEWLMGQRTFLHAGYDYYTQQFTREDTGRRSSNTIYLGIGYRGLSRRDN